MDVMAHEDGSLVLIIKINAKGQSQIECVTNSKKTNNDLISKLKKTRAMWMLLLKVDELLNNKRMEQWN